MITSSNYDIVYLTNTPSFYKLNLCEKIAQRGVKILLVFFGYGSEAVNTVVKDGDWSFDTLFLHVGDSHKRSKIKTFWRLIRLMNRIKVNKILFEGWYVPEYIIYSFLSPKKKNVLPCESSRLESSFEGMAGRIKRLVINRMGTALPSGKPHEELFDYVGFKGPKYITGSVGIFHKPKHKKKETHSPLRYIYVGRLIECKNIELLIRTFNKNGKPLTIVGSGELENRLKSIACDNINFTGFIDNDKLGEIYQDADVFILPSSRETWGLVVEEAIFWGLPVIVSDKVGSKVDMVEDLHTGLIFDHTSQRDLQRAINEMENNFDCFKQSVDAVDFDERDEKQVEAYLKILQ